MFFFKVSVILDSFKRFLPRIYKRFDTLYRNTDINERNRLLKEAYHQSPGISLDYGIMERADNVVAIKGDFGWNDVGSWDTLGSIHPPDKDGNILIAESIVIDTHESIVYSNDRLVALIGIDEIVVADSPDALLICKKNRAQEVREIVEQLKERNLMKYL
jgi:mannose-1-phosphate guanylyltransferase